MTGPAAMEPPAVDPGQDAPAGAVPPAGDASAAAAADGVSEARFEYETVPDFELPLVARLGQYPRQPDIAMDTLRAIGRRLTTGLVRLLFRLDVEGRPPDEPRVALVANHSSHLDTLAILSALPERQRRHVAVFAARDYFFERWPRATAAALLGQGIAFDRADPRELRRWIRILRQQERGWFIAYPSGSRRSKELHGGLLTVLSRSGWRIVPVQVHGTAAAWPVGAALPRPFRRLRVRFGAPLDDLGETALVAGVAAAWEAS